MRADENAHAFFRCLFLLSMLLFSLSPFEIKGADQASKQGKAEELRLDVS